MNNIPIDTDILLTHSPPHMILDRVINRPENVGCKYMIDKVLEVNPIVHCFGHIHEEYGSRRFHDTLFLNASSIDVNYNISNKPFELELDIERKTVNFI